MHDAVQHKIIQTFFVLGVDIVKSVATMGTCSQSKGVNVIMKKDIVLSTGRVVSHRPYGNGATEAYIVGGGEMTNAEWIEYCTIIHAEAK